MNGLTLGLVLAAMVAASPASAQQPELKKWDAGASFGLVFGDGWYPDTDSYGEPQPAYHLELGRFWNTHLKTDTAIILTHRHEGYDYTTFALPNVPGAYSFTRHDRQLTAVSGAMTYQFFENQMMHPFVSGGLQVAAATNHRYRDAETYTINRVTYTVPKLDQRSTDVVVRPFVAVGAKSYFNERTFIKSEFSAAVSGAGFSHAILRLGFGVDF